MTSDGAHQPVPAAVSAFGAPAARAALRFRSTEASREPPGRRDSFDANSMILVAFSSGPPEAVSSFGYSSLNCAIGSRRGPPAPPNAEYWRYRRSTAAPTL